jgi:hypothetical protein
MRPLQSAESQRVRLDRSGWGPGGRRSIPVSRIDVGGMHSDAIHITCVTSGEWITEHRRVHGASTISPRAFTGGARERAIYEECLQRRSFCARAYPRVGPRCFHGKEGVAA